MTPRARAIPDWLFLLNIVAAIALRLALPYAGSNWDMGEWVREARAFLQGENVYMVTPCTRGPLWFMVLGGIRFITHLLHMDRFGFEYGVTLFLTLVDGAMAYALYRRFGRVACLLFFINPISIFITGYHRHCDTWAILLGFLAVWRLETMEDKQNWRATLSASLLLGVSLVIKHVLFLYPVWLFLRGGRPWPQRLALLIAPVVIFLLSFGPYWWDGSEGIIQNVFEYRSFNNAPLWHMILPPFLLHRIPFFDFYIASLLLLGFLTRHRPLMEQFACYLIGVVALSSAICNQYLLIPVIGLSILETFGWPYVLVCSAWLYVFSMDGLREFWHSPLLPELTRWQMSPIGEQWYRACILALLYAAAAPFLRPWMESAKRYLAGVPGEAAAGEFG